MIVHSMQFKFLITVISAMLAITLFIGGLSIYEVDNFVQTQTEAFIDTTCEKEATQINGVFGDMEKSVRIMESYLLGLIGSVADIEDREQQNEIIKYVDGMFADVAKNTDDAIAYYLRFAPEISDNKTGLFYSKVDGGEEYVSFEPTDLFLYDKDDTEHVGWYWQPYEAGEPIWMQPYRNLNNGVLMISYVVPLYYENRFIGIVGMDFDYAVLLDKVHKIKIYEHGFAHLETDGHVAHLNDDQAGAKNLSKEYLRSSRKLVNGMTLVLSASYKDIRQIRYDIALKILYVVLFLAVLFSLIVIFVVRRIVDPLKKLTDASQKLAKGNYDVEIVHSDTYEIKLLSTAFENMTMHLQEHERQQHRLAHRDSLTGLRNATSYNSWVANFDEQIQSQKMDFGVIVFDMNNLKVTNDRYGHDAGNKLIVAASQIISGTFKRSPVFRIGGDEFLVILQNSDLKNCEELIATFDSECANVSVKTDEADVAVSVAKGLAMYDPDRDSQFMDVFNRADDAMYENKREMKAAQV